MRLVERGFLVAGLLLFVGLVYEIGPLVVFDNLRVVGWGIVLIVSQEALAYVCNTLGWWYAFPAPGPPIGFAQLLAARMSGDAINYVTPTATLGGEFVRVRLLRDRVDTTTVVASVTIAKLGQTVGQVAFVVFGLMVVLEETALPPPLRRGLFIGVSVMAALAVALLVAQRRGLFAPLLRVMHAVGLPRYAAGLGGRLKLLDDEIAAFHVAESWGFVRSVAAFFAGWAMGVLEAYLILYFLGIPVTVERALAIEVFSITIDAMLFFVPGKVGTQEGGKVLIFAMLGLSAAKGLSFGILRRIRELVWAGVGLLVLSRLQADLRPVADPATIRG
jgi:uncharacterized protein (TIRG00374 family)